MALTFDDTHNMIAYLNKSDASKGFDQIIDLLNASAIKKKVIITEATVQEALRLDDAESIDCLPNEEIFTELSRMRTSWNEFSSSMASAIICLLTGRKFNFSKYIFDSLVRNVDSPSKFYMYPRFLQLMIRAQVGDLSSRTIKYSSPALTQKQAAADVDDVVADDDAADDVLIANAEPTPPSPPPSQELPSTSQVLKKKVKKLEKKRKLRVSGLKRLRKVGTTQRIKSSADTVMDDHEDASKQGGIIADIEANEDVTLKDVAAVAKEVSVEKNVEVKKDADVQGRHEESQAEAYHIDLEHVDKVLKVVTGATTPITAVAAPITAATITAAPSAARRRKGVVIRDPEETTTPSTIIHSESKSKDKGKGIMDDVIEQVQKKGKEDNVVLLYQALNRKPQTKAQARKNMMMYLKNIVGFKMDYFKGMSYDDIHPIFEKYFNSNVAFLEKTKKQKLDEEVEELKKHLQIVPDDDDNVFTEATPLALKVPVIDYEIYSENNKPHYKIIRAYGTHQLFLSFLSLLRNFDREDLEMLWQIVKERFSSLKPKNFSNDFLLTTLTYMFEKPDVEAQVWKNQRGVHGLAKVKSWRLLESCGVHIITFTTTQMILLVERRYPLTRFTFEQMLNNVKLEVEEVSELSLELLRFVSQQQLEG
nr:hypothetical protein [Tanacetum cinerariifolium]